jgi:Tol biopolymer transport system component
MIGHSSLLIRTVSFLLLVAAVTAVGVQPAVATVSGDNGKIAFVSNRDGNAEIYLMESDGSDQVNLTSNPASDFAPSWSPDGRQIVFVSDRDGDGAIFVMNSDGTGVTRVGSGGAPDWSPDGTRIAFTREFDIYVMNLDGTEVTQVTDSENVPDAPYGANGAYDYDPAWSPDGLRIAFVRHLPGPTPLAQSARLYVIKVGAGQASVNLASLGSGANEPDWSPNGLQIAVGDGRSLGDLATFVTLVKVDGSGTTQLPNPPGFGHTGTPAWSPDGELLASTAWVSNAISPAREIFVMNVDGSGTPINLTNNPASDSDPAWQPLNPYPAGLVDPATGIWRLRDATGEVRTFYYGNPGDVPFMGDWDGDGVDTPGLYRQSDGYVYLRNTNTEGIADIRFFFGNPGDLPLAGDFDGDGYDTVSLYRPSEQRFYVINRLGSGDAGLGVADFSFGFGNPGDEPFVGDFNGDGVDEIGLHRDSTGRVYLRFSLTTGIADLDFLYGNPHDRIVAGDWNGDGTDTPALFRSSNRTHYFRFTNTEGMADAHYIWGESHWLLITGDFEES